MTKCSVGGFADVSKVRRDSSRIDSSRIDSSRIKSNRINGIRSDRISNDSIGNNDAETERGSGSALALMLIFGIFAASLFVTVFATVNQARWQAQTAADFGALAGASAWRMGLNPCEVASIAVGKNSGNLTGCELLPQGEVKVSTSIMLNLLGNFTVVAQAQAAPRS